MLPAKYRLKSKKEFDEVFRRGKTVSNGVVIAKYQEDGSGSLRIGFSVGVKFSKKAVRRNRAKRWLREAVRPAIGKMRPGRKIIFLINSKFPYEQINLSLVKKGIEDLLGKSKLLK